MTYDQNGRKAVYPNLSRALGVLAGRQHLARPHLHKDRCDYLVFEIQDLKREIGRLADRMEEGKRRIKDLREDAMRALLMGAAAALFDAIGPLGDAIQVARRISKISDVRNLTKADVFELLQAFVPLGVTIGSLAQFVNDLVEVQDVIDALESYEASGEDLAWQMGVLLDEAEELGCFHPAYIGS